MATLADFAKRPEVEFYTPDLPNYVYRFKGGVLYQRGTADTKYAIGSNVSSLSLAFAIRSNFEEYRAPMIVKRWVASYVSPYDQRDRCLLFRSLAEANREVAFQKTEGHRCSEPVEVTMEIP